MKGGDYLKKDKTYTCGYVHCKCKESKISSEDGIKIGNRYYHKECVKIRNDIKEIEDYYIENISSTVVSKQLLSVVNNMVFNKNIPTDYILFALKYNKKYKIFNINYPSGMYYLIDNYKIKQSYKKWQEQKIRYEMRNDKDDDCEKSDKSDVVSSNTFVYTPDQNNGFGGILL